MGLVEVFNLRDYSEFKNVLNIGLRSRRSLMRKGILKEEKPRSSFEKWRWSLIYFGLEEGREEYPWVSILVDPEKTLVGNDHFEGSPIEYLQSVMKLSTYLERSRGSKKIEPSHPTTGERGKHKDTRGIYVPEVIIEADKIRRFWRVHKGIRTG